MKVFWNYELSIIQKIKRIRGMTKDLANDYYPNEDC